ncbi:hypothetical protein JWS13_31820 [Rhodococcus pseudokoreensis]|uniref:DUF3263 domain-containing protein n=1 Tax=Rhodococcus pseudokoreensis TaxID=2811421 RepID=A0A974W7R4_9NOCA|nr:hypothetical protein [Rhodococcus pseudokoreensis]QSE92858.1 hypothetical protein JWS13_31820 [Rhodococcus pseudokoreensis]
MDAAILEFACRWLPYGGPPPDEIWIGFGMTTPGFDRRLSRILESVGAREVPADVRARLHTQLSERARRWAIRSRSTLSL